VHVEVKMQNFNGIDDHLKFNKIFYSATEEDTRTFMQLNEKVKQEKLFEEEISKQEVDIATIEDYYNHSFSQEELEICEEQHPPLVIRIGRMDPLSNEEAKDICWFLYDAISTHPFMKSILEKCNFNFKSTTVFLYTSQENFNNQTFLKGKFKAACDLNLGYIHIMKKKVLNKTLDNLLFEICNAANDKIKELDKYKSWSYATGDCNDKVVEEFLRNGPDFWAELNEYTEFYSAKMLSWLYSTAPKNKYWNWVQAKYYAGDFPTFWQDQNIKHAELSHADKYRKDWKIKCITYAEKNFYYIIDKFLKEDDIFTCKSMVELFGRDKIISTIHQKYQTSLVDSLNCLKYLEEMNSQSKKCLLF
jgi:hypothetical protein